MYQVYIIRIYNIYKSYFRYMYCELFLVFTLLSFFTLNIINLFPNPHSIFQLSKFPIVFTDR